MTIHHAVHEDLPEAIREQVLALGAEMWQTAMQADQSASEVEEQVRQLSLEVGQVVLSAGLSERFGKHQGTGRDCECRATQRFEGYRTRQVMTTLGAVSYRRAYCRIGRGGGRLQACGRGTMQTCGHAVDETGRGCSPCYALLVAQPALG